MSTPGDGDLAGGQLERIGRKLRAAGEVPGNHEAFGAARHGFRLNPPLPAGTVAAFEREHGIVLPPAYRRFVTGLGDGGAGPTYGIVPLHRAAPRFWHHAPGAMAAPSHFVPGATYPDGWWEEGWNEDDVPERLQGVLVVAHHGCSYHTLLMVSGPAYGRLVSVCFDQGGPVELEDPDFLAWYERWLDGLAAGYDVSNVWNTLPGDEAALLAIARQDPDNGRRVRAVRSVNALPDLTAAGRSTIAELAGEASAPVRSTALFVAEKYHAAEADRPARQALQDHDPAVRRAALRALQALQAPDLPALAASLLHDPAEPVALQAIWTLRDVGALRAAHLLPLTTSPDPSMRTRAVQYLRDVSEPVDDDVLLTALGDDVASVRRTAVQTVAHLQRRHMFPRLQEMRAVETDPTVQSNLSYLLDPPPGP